jgi:S1-C subfamily serine protease
MARELPPRALEALTGGVLATLELHENNYELVAAPGAEVWVNGEPVERRVLVSGDVLEIGEGGPVLRFRLYKPGAAAYKSMSEVFSDCRDCARHGGRTAVQRAGILLASAPRELATQTTPMVRFGLVTVLILFVGTASALWVRNARLEQRIVEETARVEGIAELLEQAESESYSQDDFNDARRVLEQRLSDALERVAALEARAQSRRRVISTAVRSVVFLQGAYGFVHAESGRPLRFAGAPPSGPDAGDVQVTLEGDGPLVEIFYTGTAFVATADGLLLTNRHVALPWENDARAHAVMQQGFTAEMHRFIGYLPGMNEAFDVELVRSSDSADVALLRCAATTGSVTALALAERPPSPGDEVIVLGYPTGMQALMARAEPTFVEELLSEGPLDFWELANGLAVGGHVAPLATVGVVGQVTTGSVVYDAETAHGGSGGPVLDLDGRVVAVNAAIVPQFGGSNLGVPSAEAARLLQPPAPDEERIEATSLLGEPLYAPSLDAEFRSEQQSKLDAARAELESLPGDADAIVWVGRRTAYLGRYREAVQIYTRGIDLHPEDARFLRHRGHRRITLRELDSAVADLERAASLVEGAPDRTEPDGLPNARNTPTSTLQSNIWYHLGLAHYLRGDFASAERAYRECLRYSDNSDMLSATSHWLYMTLRRLGRDDAARAVLDPIHADMDIIENHDYHRLLLMYRGELHADDLLESAREAGGVGYASTAYGVGNWYLADGDRKRAARIFEQIVSGKEWAAFGFIAAEAELARLQDGS